MLSRSIASISRIAPMRALRPSPVFRQGIPSLVRYYADKIIQVPVMAESISEGTLKQFSKSIGDYVEVDEEIATIETDKVCCH